MNETPDTPDTTGAPESQPADLTDTDLEGVSGGSKSGADAKSC